MHLATRTCWFSEVEVSDDGAVQSAGRHESSEHQPATTLYALERTIQQRRETMEAGTGMLEGLPPVNSDPGSYGQVAALSMNCELQASCELLGACELHWGQYPPHSSAVMLCLLPQL
jgi:hypothetical protein